MLQKITDLWPALLRRGNVDPDEEEEALLGRGADGDDPDDALRVDEPALLTAFKNLYWTRLIAVEGFSTTETNIIASHGLADNEQQYRWPLGPDIVEEC